jgi:hypothetical protein
MGSSSGSSAGGGYKKPVIAGGPLRTPSLVALLNQGDAAAGPSGGRPGKSAGGGRTQALFTVPPAGDKAAGEGSPLSLRTPPPFRPCSLSLARARALTFFVFVALFAWPTRALRVWVPSASRATVGRPVRHRFQERSAQDQEPHGPQGRRGARQPRPKLVRGRQRVLKKARSWSRLATSRIHTLLTHKQALKRR